MTTSSPMVLVNQLLNKLIIGSVLEYLELSILKTLEARLVKTLRYIQSKYSSR
jgi:hypothetical protein